MDELPPYPWAPSRTSVFKPPTGIILTASEAVDVKCKISKGLREGEHEISKMYLTIVSLRSELLDCKRQLSELRPDVRPTREFLDRLWKFLQVKKVELPIDLMTEYVNLNETDPYFKSAPKAPASSGSIDAPAQADTKQNQADEPGHITGDNSTVREKIPSGRPHSPDGLTPTSEGFTFLAPELSDEDCIDVKNEHKLPRDLHSSSPMALTEEGLDTPNKRRRPGEAEYVLKRRKIVQDVATFHTLSSNHVAPDVEIKPKSEGNTSNVSVKPEK